MGRVITIISSAMILFSCARQANDLDLLAEYMTGSFRSQEQAQSDTNFSDISLEMARIWKDRTDGYWFYVEQAAAANLDKPYRQRVYQLTQRSDSLLQSTVFTFNDPLKYTGAWKDNDLLADLSPEKLKEREGCAIVMKVYAPGVFVGSTESLRCDSNLRGATYATSVVLINKDQIYSWDRGFDMNGNQVWGAQTGGYVFKRVNK
jgi:CpeT protein